MTDEARECVCGRTFHVRVGTPPWAVCIDCMKQEPVWRVPADDGSGEVIRPVTVTPPIGKPGPV